MDGPAVRRSDATRSDLMSGFTRLVFAKGFERVSVQEIAAEAGHARSTFYEHFSSKEDVLRACMAHFFEVIAECPRSETMPAELVRVLEHLWHNRRLTDAIFSGAPRSILARSLADMVERHFREMGLGNPLPPRLAALAIAEGQLALVENWLRGRAHCSVQDLADGLHRTSRAGALSLASGQHSDP